MRSWVSLSWFYLAQKTLFLPSLLHPLLLTLRWGEGSGKWISHLWPSTPPSLFCRTLSSCEFMCSWHYSHYTEMLLRGLRASLICDRDTHLESSSIPEWDDKFTSGDCKLHGHSPWPDYSTYPAWVFSCRVGHLASPKAIIPQQSCHATFVLGQIFPG